jgi:hypothetical protein
MDCSLIGHRDEDGGRVTDKLAIRGPAGRSHKAAPTAQTQTREACPTCWRWSGQVSLRGCYGSGRGTPRRWFFTQQLGSSSSSAHAAASTLRRAGAVHGCCCRCEGSARRNDRKFITNLIVDMLCCVRQLAWAGACPAGLPQRSYVILRRRRRAVTASFHSHFSDLRGTIAWPRFYTHGLTLAANTLPHYCFPGA